jgi:hypothetical protein
VGKKTNASTNTKEKIKMNKKQLPTAKPQGNSGGGGGGGGGSPELDGELLDGPCTCGTKYFPDGCSCDWMIERRLAYPKPWFPKAGGNLSASELANEQQYQFDLEREKKAQFDREHEQDSDDDSRSGDPGNPAHSPSCPANTNARGIPTFGAADPRHRHRPRPSPAGTTEFVAGGRPARIVRPAHRSTDGGGAGGSNAEPPKQ